jgi:hypothetical protein
MKVYEKRQMETKCLLLLTILNLNLNYEKILPKDSFFYFLNHGFYAFINHDPSRKVFLRFLVHFSLV